MDECLRSVYEEGRSQEQVEQHRGQFFHMARGGEGWQSPWPKDWPREQRPACVIPVCNWNDVLWHLGLYGEAGTDVPETLGVAPPELSEMIAQVIRDEAFESRAREPPAEPR